MTTDSSANPPPNAPDEGARGTPSSPGAPSMPPRRRRHRALKALAWTAGIVALVVAMTLGALYGALPTERGTRLAWQTAVKVLGGRLAGNLEGGALATGVRLSGVHWRSLDGTGSGIRTDRTAAPWSLARAPWRFSVDYLHVGTIDARIAPSPPSAGPKPLPRDLQLPMH